ncbi:hypothetical protein RGQ15_11075 [Paracoccus sp. MBLB3053]|uniref:Sialate O-acetylesterase domain-containing protein n=1 Tax=Paracoccus aurantius TaxID=3073814 RepID=A0ABU2HSU1_9RHOB|nr:hypothetical protein [Paracoccus sp. MBLB3053]MDS9468108.1 hypothetical protein [Paracoccus sp. MBLB3053]
MADHDARGCRGFSAGGVTAPVPSVTSLEIMPVYGQSENRPLQETSAADIETAAREQVYYTYGLRDRQGSLLGPLGAGLGEIDQSVTATGFMSATGQGRVSPAFTFQFARAARWRDEGRTAQGTIIGDNGFGGRQINEWIASDPSPLGRNQTYWMRESARLANEFGIALSCPYVFLFQGTSAKDQVGSSYRADFETAHTETLNEAQSLFGASPRLVVVVNGADVNSIGDLYETPGAQYRLAMEHDGIVATWQRVFLINDLNIHPTGRTQVLIGETCDWAVSEVEAGNVWNITYSVAKSGAHVTVRFSLRPGETLMSRPDLYDAFGGSATCLDFGFEAEGGIQSALPDWEGDSVTLVLRSASAGWLRFAHQLQDCYAMADAQGRTMSAHRSTLFGSHTRESRFVPGERLWRPLPGFRGKFSGDLFIPE